MAGRDPLNSIADVAALEAEADKVIAIVRGIDEAVKSVSQIKTLYKNAEGSVEQKKASEDLATANKAVEAAQKQLNKEMEKASSLQSELAKQIAIQKELNKDRQKQLNAEAREAAGLNDAYKKLELQYAAAAREAKNLAATYGANSKEAQDAAAKANALNQQLKGIDASVGEFRRNVGNYPESARIIVDALERARTKFNDLSKAADTTPAALQRAKVEFEALRNITDDRQFLSFAAKAGDAQKEVRAFTKVLVDMESKQMGDTEAAIALRKRLAELTDQIADTKAEVQALASDTRSFDLFAGSIKFASDTFQVAASSAIAFGASEEDAAEATKTLLAIQNISSGVQGIANELTTRGTAANKLYAFAQNQVAIAMDGTAAAGARLRAVLITIGFGALIIGIGLLLANLDKVKRAITGVSKEQEMLNEVNTKAIEGYAAERAQIDLTVKKLQDENLTREDKARLIDELQHTYPQLLGNIKNEGELTEDLAKAIKDKLIPALELEAKAKAAQQLATEKYKQLLELQNNAIEKGSTGVALVLQSLGASFNSASLTAKGYAEALKNTNEETAQLQKEIDDLFKISLDAGDQLKKLKGTATDHTIKSSFTDITKEIEARAKLIEMIKKQKVELTKAFSGSEDTPESVRIKSLEKAYALEKEIINDRTNIALRLNTIEQQKLKHDTAEQLNNLKLTEKEKEAIRLQAASNERALILQRKAIVLQTEDDLLKAEITYNTARGKIHADTLKKVVDDEKITREALAGLEKVQIDNLKAANERRIAYIEQARDIQISALDKQYADGQISEQQYQDQRKKLETDADIYILQARKELLQSQIAFAKANGKDTVLLEAQYANIERQINDKKNQDKIESDKKVFDKKKELKQQEIELEKRAAEQVGSTINAFIIGAYERQLNSLQDQIDANTKLKNAELERVNQSTLSEQDKAARIAQINAEAQIREDQLQQRQREIKLKAAKFERDEAILKIGIATAQAVAKSKLEASVLLSNPVTAPLAAMALAQIPIEIGIGAAQIAAILARPLPKFATGTDYSPEGFAIVGELGPELRKDPDGKVSMTPGVPTLTYLQQGTQIIPHDEVNKMMLHAMMQNVVKVPEREDLTAKKIDRLTDIIKWQHQELISAWARIAKQNRTIIPPNWKDYGKDYLP